MSGDLAIAQRIVAQRGCRLLGVKRPFASDYIWIAFDIGGTVYVYSVTIPFWNEIYHYAQKMRSQGVEQEARCFKIVNKVKGQVGNKAVQQNKGSLPSEWREWANITGKVNK